jgi:hypothetical protein
MIVLVLLHRNKVLYIGIDLIDKQHFNVLYYLGFLLSLTCI